MNTTQIMMKQNPTDLCFQFDPIVSTIIVSMIKNKEKVS